MVRPGPLARLRGTALSRTASTAQAPAPKTSMALCRLAPASTWRVLRRSPPLFRSARSHAALRPGLERSTHCNLLPELFQRCTLATAALCCFLPRASASAASDDDVPKHTSPPGGWRGALDDVPVNDPRLDWPLLLKDGSLDCIGWNRYNTERRQLSYRRFHEREKRIAATPLEQLCVAAEKDSVPDALAALAAGADIHGKRERAGLSSDEPPLSVAAEHGGVDVARLLLNRGADIEQRDRWGATPLSYAASGKSVAMIELLTAAGADVDGADNCRWTPLFYAAGGGREAQVAALLRAGANVQGTGLRAPLHYAVGRDCNSTTGSHKSLLGAMRLLLDAGADVNVRAKEDESSAFEAAVERANVPAVQLLLSYGADPAVRPYSIKDAESNLDCTLYGSRYAVILQLLREASEARRAAPQHPPAECKDA